MTAAQIGLSARLLEALSEFGPLDDDELGSKLGVTRQSARSAAMRLGNRGLVKREKPVGGKWLTTPGVGTTPRTATAQSPETSSSEPISIEAVAEAMALLHGFTGGYPPKRRLVSLEARIERRDVDGAARLLGEEKLNDSLLIAALVIKRLAGEINVVIHAVGIMLAIPLILDQPGERVIATSLGAGAGTRSFDLETTHRVAEFKFTHWRGHDALRQRELFADFVNLAESEDLRIKQLFVTGLTRPKRFLFRSKRSLASVCRRRPEVNAKIETAHGSRFETVADYANAVCGRVELVDLEAVLPGFITQQIEVAEQTSDELRDDDQ